MARMTFHVTRVRRMPLPIAASISISLAGFAGCLRGGGSSVSVSTAALRADSPPPGAMWLEELDLSTLEQEWGEPKAGKSFDGHPLTLNGQVFPHGIGTLAHSEWVIDLNGCAEWFSAAVGIDAEAGREGSVAFAVWVDGREAFRSRLMRGNDACEVVRVDLRGARRMGLAVENGGDGPWRDRADWAGAMIGLAPGATGRPRAVRLVDESTPDLWRPPADGSKSSPVIHAPRITGGTPGKPFLFRIPATGAAPLRFSVDKLPDGLSLDAATGILSGAIKSAGRTTANVTVENGVGQATSTLTIVGETGAVALTPPMGWNSWNVWGKSVDDAKVRAAADAMVVSGLAACGYSYVNIDDAWEGTRDARGRIRSNDKFPDMKALADYVHSRGLKLGIYSSPGPRTCAEFEGSYQHEEQDAKTYAEWGVDLLKYDWCSYDQIAKSDNHEEMMKPYRVMRAALDGCGRDVVYSLCQYGRGRVWEWGKEVGGNYWRTTGDIVDSWWSMSGIAERQSHLNDYAGPGHWNDPDMLVVGKVGWGPELHPTRLTPNEQVAHITWWSLLAAPLLVGCDMTAMDEFTRAVLTNPEVLEINQDALGKQGLRIAQYGRTPFGPWADRTEVWIRPLADGGSAVGIFNRGRDEAKVRFLWSDVLLQGPFSVRNVWQRREEGVSETDYQSRIPSHGAILLRVTDSGRQRP